MLRSKTLAPWCMWLSVFPACVLSACSGGVTEDGTHGTSKPHHASTDGGVHAGDTGDDAEDDTSNEPDPVNSEPTSVTPTPVTPVTPKPGETTRLARLTHSQYANTIRDLFGIEDDVTAGFPPDALNGFEFTSSVNFLVDSRLAPQYQTTAEELALRTLSDDDVYATVVGCDDESAACRDAFIADFGLRAFRRPLTESEATRITTLFDSGADLVGGESPFQDGVQVVVEALLQSPYFLYRTELSNADPGETVPLNDYEVASRLAYFLYDSMPDTELLNAAKAGELSTPQAVQAQVERLIDAARTTQQLVSFHEQAWHFDRYTKIAPDAELFPDLPNDLAARLGAASRRFVQAVIEADGGVKELLTAPFAYADAPIAQLYGLDVTGDDLQRVEFDPETRLGLLSQAGFLASHAHTRKSDPIHRGLFVVRDLLCRSIGDPPASASSATLPEGSNPRTTREEVTLLTSPTGCVECHQVINPPGFAFESFDAVGQWRVREGDVDVDTQANVTLDGEDHDISGAVELIELLGSSTEVHSCYVNKWFTFAHGRKATSIEAETLTALSEPMSVRELVTQIATDASFLTRPATEVSQ